MHHPDIHRSALTLTLAMIMLLIAAKDTRAEATPPAGYTLVFSDEFNGSSLDRAAWCTRLAYGNGASLQVEDAECRGPKAIGGTGDFLKDERQRYRDYNSRGEALHQVGDGYLRLSATQTGSDSYASFESAMVRSKASWKPSADTSYYIVTRVRLPNLQGSFAAVWLASGFGSDGKAAWPPELDILEGALNVEDDRENMVRVGAHVQGPQTNSGAEELGDTGPLFDERWNNYVSSSSMRNVWLDVATEWTQDQMCVYFAGDLAACVRYRWVDNAGIAASPAQLILNLAVGGAWAGRYGIDTSRPMTMDIDYVRVYKK
jgi:beta-glucanase (GH16 family)